MTASFSAGLVTGIEKTAAAAFDREKFKEGLVDEGIPLGGATLGAALGSHLGKGKGALTGAALGYAAGSGASLLRPHKDGEGPSLGRRLLALSGLGYGIGGLAHGGTRYLTKGIKPGTLKSVFHGVEGLAPGAPSKWTHAREALVEEGLPALGATLGAGYAMGSQRQKK